MAKPANRSKKRCGKCSLLAILSEQPALVIPAPNGPVPNASFSRRRESSSRHRWIPTFVGMTQEARLCCRLLIAHGDFAVAGLAEELVPDLHRVAREFHIHRLLPRNDGLVDANALLEHFAG